MTRRCFMPFFRENPQSSRRWIEPGLPAAFARPAVGLGD
jgi:hypothetical protein